LRRVVRRTLLRVATMIKKKLLKRKIDNFTYCIHGPGTVLPGRCSMKGQGNRVTIGRGVSLPLEVSEAVDRRIAELAPWVRGFSDYLQHLIKEDITKGVLSPAPLSGSPKS